MTLDQAKVNLDKFVLSGVGNASDLADAVQVVLFNLRCQDQDHCPACGSKMRRVCTGNCERDK